MLESLAASLQDFFRNVRIVDFLDVAFISTFLYLILNWLRQSASHRSIISIVSLFALYVLARFTEMYLTELLIEGLFAVILIGMVVVFQSDIRRLVERIGSWSIFWNSSATAPGTMATNIITEAVSRMADNKVGALIVLKGKEAWDRHIHGGIELNGNVSIPLLHSIFNPKAPGHDGAVLMEGEKIVRFGAHLPLSTRLEEIPRGGTRHAAALGLSEQCDVLVVVVSEERGTISLAQHGVLKKLESGNQLKGELDTFWKEYYTYRESSLTNWWSRRDLRTAIASLTLAIIFWFAFAYQTETVYRTFAIPIEYRSLQTSNIILQDSVPLEARVTLSGSEQAFRLFDPSQLVVSFNLSGYTGTRELDITENNLNLPSDLKLYEVSPRSLKIKARQLQEVQLPVKVPTQGKLPNQLSLISIKPGKTSITVLADELNKNLPETIATEPIDLSGINESKTLTKKLVMPENIRLAGDDASNEISVAVQVKARES